MSFTRAKPAGWIAGDEITAAQINQIDINQSRAVDGFAGGSYAPTAALTWAHQLIVNVTTVVPANADAIQSVGKGSGYGLSSTGGAASGSGAHCIGGAGSGYGIVAEGGAPNGSGVYALGTGLGFGALCIGGASSGAGLEAEGGVPNGDGGHFLGVGSGSGIIATGGVTNGIGGEFLGVGSGSGIRAHGGVTNGTGVIGLGAGAAAGACGVLGIGTGTGTGSIGVSGINAAGYGVVAQGDVVTNPPVYAAFRIVPQLALPTAALVGDLCVLSGDQKLYICTVAPAGWTVVGSQ